MPIDEARQDHRSTPPLPLAGSECGSRSSQDLILRRRRSPDPGVVVLPQRIQAPTAMREEDEAASGSRRHLHLPGGQAPPPRALHATRRLSTRRLKAPLVRVGPAVGACRLGAKPVCAAPAARDMPPLSPAVMHRLRALPECTAPTTRPSPPCAKRGEGEERREREREVHEEERV